MADATEKNQMDSWPGTVLTDAENQLNIGDTWL